MIIYEEFTCTIRLLKHELYFSGFGWAQKAQSFAESSLEHDVVGSGLIREPLISCPQARLRRRGGGRPVVASRSPTV